MNASETGKDMTVNLWAINTDVLDAAVASGGRGVAPYAELIEGGSKGEFYQEMVDFFYFAQLRSQGEGATESREASGKVPIVEMCVTCECRGQKRENTKDSPVLSLVLFSFSQSKLDEGAWILPHAN